GGTDVAENQPDQKKDGGKPSDTPPEGKNPEGAAVEEEPGVLTVSQKPEVGGKYRSINEALAKVQAGQTIRVLDEAVYREQLHIKDNPRFAGIPLEAVRGATLERMELGNLIEIDAVPGLLIRGFRMRAGKTGAKERTMFIVVEGRCPGLVLERL